MSRPLLDSGSGRLVPVPDGGPIGAETVGVAASLGAGHALLTVETDEPVRVAVRLAPLAEVPDGVLAVGRALAAHLDLGTGESRWRLEPVTPVDLRRLRLELLTEGSIDAAVAALAAAGLDGRVLWHSARDEPWLPVEGVEHEIRSVDTAGPTEVAARITPGTEIEVFAAGVRSGVDIVILADCSGSMLVEDLEPYGEGGFSPARHGTRISRTHALRQALYDLLEVRLRVDGRVSRVALVEFTEETTTRFPRTGGMVELDGSSPPELVAEFRHAIAVLAAQNGRRTDIGNALHEAANLLYYSGRPDNEKLIVLVSDGANWTPRGDQGTGEVVGASTEPVSLMAHLHQNTGIRLHAIGISTPEHYQRWMAVMRQSFNPALNPNHELLEQLVSVGGGDPTTIGGLDVLAAYFSGLGAGITRGVRVERAGGRRPGPLPAEAARLLADTGRAPADGTAARRSRVAGELGELAGRCNTEAERVFGRALLDATQAMTAVKRSLANRGTGDNAVVRFTRDVKAFRPSALPQGAGRAVTDGHAALTGYIDDLRGVERDGSVDHAALAALAGGPPAGDPGAAVDAAAEHLLALLRGWHEALAAERPVRVTVPDGPAFTTREDGVPAGARSGGDHGEGHGGGHGGSGRAPGGDPGDLSGTTSTGSDPAPAGDFVFRD
ncbi:vWA domain-containing protein [Actinomadura roseirufa]|uniref:vWA domain-containing protein n=1 Tax=Actinomadura roseirufa TaxID=2094049 RepID=UPI001041A727|nr:vWA domain-containing protein [Actinomadura roseirufa]